jgi:hypothetical protein
VGANIKKISQRVQRLAQKAIATGHGMTYKSTVHDACKAVGLCKFEIELPVRQRAWRYVFASAKFVDWVNNCVPKIVLAQCDEDDSLQIQIEKELFGFSYGEYLREPSEIRRLDPQPQAVWELKTPDLRLFGWFPAKDHFVAHLGCEKEALQRWEDYEPFINEVREFRASLIAALPHHVTGGIWNVVSNRP